MDIRAAPIRDCRAIALMASITHLDLEVLPLAVLRHGPLDDAGTKAYLCLES
jgi:hypothetical protein